MFFQKCFCERAVDQKIFFCEVLKSEIQSCTDFRKHIGFERGKQSILKNRIFFFKIFLWTGGWWKNIFLWGFKIRNSIMHWLSKTYWVRALQQSILKNRIFFSKIFLWTGGDQKIFFCEVLKSEIQSCTDFRKHIGFERGSN